MELDIAEGTEPLTVESLQEKILDLEAKVDANDEQARKGVGITLESMLLLLKRVDGIEKFLFAAAEQARKHAEGGRGEMPNPVEYTGSGMYL